MANPRPKKAIAADEAKHRSILTGEVLKRKASARSSSSELAMLACRWLPRPLLPGDPRAEMLEVRRLWSWSGGRNT